MMEILKKYWWCFLAALIAVPIGLNFILLIPAFTPIVGDNQIWLSFIGTLIGALASFVMIFFTAKTLEQNKEQLDELKRQWREQNRPILNGRIIIYQKSYFLEIYNSGNMDANNITVSLNSDFYNNIPDSFKYLYDNMTSAPFCVRANDSVFFYLDTCKSLEKQWKGLSFNIEIKGNYNSKYNLNIILPINNYIGKIHMIVRTPIEKALEDISEGLVSPHLISEPQSIQLYLRSIAETLNHINENLTNGTEQDK